MQSTRARNIMRKVRRIFFTLLPALVFAIFFFISSVNFTDAYEPSPLTWEPKTWPSGILGYINLGLYHLATIVSNLTLDPALRFTLDSENISKIKTIDAGWRIFRDLLNMVFIFALLYMAISIILDIKSSEAKRSLPSVVLAAILVNFSMFFVKVIIDAGNIVAVQFYNAITDYGLHSFSAQIMSGFSLHNFVAGTIESDGSRLFTGETAIPIVLEMVQFIIFIIALFIFIAVAALFVIRSVMLVFLLILSPIGIIGSAIPFLQSYSKRFWKHLIKNVLSVPVFLLFAYIILSLSKAGELIGEDELTIGIFFFNFAILAGLWIAAVRITFSLSESFGVSLSTAAAGLVGGGAVGFAMGKVGMVGRQVVGRRGSWDVRREALQKEASNQESGFVASARRARARAGIVSGDYFSKASFDPRAVGAGSALNKGLGLMGLSADFGSGHKGGFKKAQEERVQKLTERVDLYTGKDPERMRQIAKEYEGSELGAKKQASKKILRGAKKEDALKDDAIKTATEIEEAISGAIQDGSKVADVLERELGRATNRHIQLIKTNLLVGSGEIRDGADSYFQNSDTENSVRERVSAGEIRAIYSRMTRQQKEATEKYYARRLEETGLTNKQREQFSAIDKFLRQQRLGPDTDREGGPRQADHQASQLPRRSRPRRRRNQDDQDAQDTTNNNGYIDNYY